MTTKLLRFQAESPKGEKITFSLNWWSDGSTIWYRIQADRGDSRAYTDIPCQREAMKDLMEAREVWVREGFLDKFTSFTTKGGVGFHE
ncbi:hypothetical protein X832_gp072 [Pseudomonas phage PAK_P5]|uniref:Uncharacterized protein n=1 Tax=Pseudomonas phage PAK_P5 TaxID=1327964 RepID=V5JXU0_9CAUD|nr:hypothetical protein X832_gp072 [Pseudomonas phage PAK_P5]AGR89542.1 hypothetical protein PAK_P500072 [Pseudomonas phage PAK_P5]